MMDTSLGWKSRMEIRYVEYHSREWDNMVEHGWYTVETYPEQGGCPRMAKMGWTPRYVDGTKVYP